MTRRLTLAMVAVVLATLVVAGVATVAITQARSTRATEQRLVDQVGDLTTTMTALQQFFDRVATARAREGADGTGPLSAAARSRLLDREGCPLRTLGRALRVRQAECVLVDGDGSVTAGSPAGAPGALAQRGVPAQLDRGALAAGEVVSGSARGTAWAASALRPSTATPSGDADLAVVLLAQDVTSELTPVRRWLAVAGLLALAFGAGVAAWLGRRLARPLVAAEQATARLAAGDLSTRLPEPTSDDELGRLTRSINELAAALQRSRGLEQQFLLSISHDLRTPLTSIRGYADALADGTLVDVGRGASVIRREAGRLERLVRDLLDLARLDAHQFSLRRVHVDLGAVASQAVAAFAPDAERDGLELVLAGGPGGPGTGPVGVVGDGDRLAQVFANLVENALKFAQRRVEVAVGSTGGGAWVTVVDDGPGLAAHDLPHLFERLYVAERLPLRRESGSGLGLAIVRELVVAHGGTVVAEALGTDGGGGTRMVVRLPSAAPAAPGQGPTAPAADAPDRPPTAAPRAEAAAPPGPEPGRPARPA